MRERQRYEGGGIERKRERMSVKDTETKILGGRERERVNEREKKIL